MQVSIHHIENSKYQTGNLSEIGIVDCEVGSTFNLRQVDSYEFGVMDSKLYVLKY